MTVYVNQSVQKGVPVVVAFPVDKISPFRFYIRLNGVNTNNIRLLGILLTARRVNASEPSQFYVIESFEVRQGRQSFLSAPQSGYLAGDALQFIPLYDFATCVIND